MSRFHLQRAMAVVVCLSVPLLAGAQPPTVSIAGTIAS